MVCRRGLGGAAMTATLDRLTNALAESSQVRLQ